MASYHDFPAAPLMALHLAAAPPRAVTDAVHEHQQFECWHRLEQSPAARLPPVVDHLVVVAPVTIFVSYGVDSVPGVRVSGPSHDAVTSIDVRVHRDTGLEIAATRNHTGRILVEILLPTPHSLRLIDARDRATVVLESAIANDVKADVRLHHVGECALFVSSREPLEMNSLTLDPQGGGLIQVVAPSIRIGAFFEGNVPALGKIRVFTGTFAAPVVTMKTAGYGSVQIAALEFDAMAKATMTAVGQAHVLTIGDTFRTALLTASTSGMGNVSVLAFNELLANAIESDASGAGEVHIASHYGHADATHLSVAGKGLVDARDVVARVANVHAAGAATVVFRASENAHTKISGYGTATLVGVLPPRVTGRPNTAPAMPSRVDELAASRKPPVTAPTRRDAFAHHSAAWTELQLPSMADFTSALKALWGGHHDDEEQERP